MYLADIYNTGNAINVIVAAVLVLHGCNWFQWLGLTDLVLLHAIYVQPSNLSCFLCRQGLLEVTDDLVFLLQVLMKL